MFKLPIDAYVVIVPMTYACGALAGLVYKTLATDPECTNASFYDKPEAEVTARADAWNDGIAGLFKERIKRNKFGVFSNIYEGSPQ